MQEWRELRGAAEKGAEAGERGEAASRAGKLERKGDSGNGNLAPIVRTFPHLCAGCKQLFVVRFGVRSQRVEQAVVDHGLQPVDDSGPRKHRLYNKRGGVKPIYMFGDQLHGGPLVANDKLEGRNKGGLRT